MIFVHCSVGYNLIKILDQKKSHHHIQERILSGSDCADDNAVFALLAQVVLTSAALPSHFPFLKKIHYMMLDKLDKKPITLQSSLMTFHIFLCYSNSCKIQNVILGECVGMRLLSLMRFIDSSQA